MKKTDELRAAVENGRSKIVPGLVQEALAGGEAPADLLNVMVSAMDTVGERFKKNEIFVPEMLVAAKAMKKGVEELKPLLADGGAERRGKMIMGTVYGDLHDIGKNLVIMMIESAGFEVEDLGVDVSVSKFLERAGGDDVDLVGVSALLTTTMPAMRETVEALNTLPNRRHFKIMVGGAPITQEFADSIGADAYTSDAASAAQRAKELVS